MPRPYRTHDLIELRQVSPKEGKAYRQINTARWAIGEVARRHGFEPSEALLELAEAAFVLPEVHSWIPLPGVLEVIHELAGHVNLGIASNTRSHLLIERTLEHFGIKQHFSPIVTSADCGWRKPSPKIFQQVIDAWGLPPTQLVMIGDSLRKDVAGAKALGMRTIWLRLNASASTSNVHTDAIADTAVHVFELLTSWGLPDTPNAK